MVNSLGGVLMRGEEVVGKFRREQFAVVETRAKFGYHYFGRFRYVVELFFDQGTGRTQHRIQRTLPSGF